MTLRYFSFLPPHLIGADNFFFSDNKFKRMHYFPVKSGWKCEQSRQIFFVCLEKASKESYTNGISGVSIKKSSISEVDMFVMKNRDIRSLRSLYSLIWNNPSENHRSSYTIYKYSICTGANIPVTQLYLNTISQCWVKWETKSATLQKNRKNRLRSLFFFFLDSNK